MSRRETIKTLAFFTAGTRIIFTNQRDQKEFTARGSLHHFHAEERFKGTRAQQSRISENQRMKSGADTRGDFGFFSEQNAKSLVAVYERP